MMNIRWMIRGDMPTVMAIEQQSFDAPWSEEEFIRRLRKRNCIGLVAESEGQVVGFVLYDLHKGRLALGRIAVHPSSRRHGVGKAMMDKLKAKLCPEGRNRITVNVHEANLSAQLFFSRQGMRATGVLRGHFGEQDAYAMMWRLQSEVMA